MGSSTDVELSVGNLPREAWISMTESGPLFASLPWLKAAEGRAAGTPHYFVLHDGGRPSAGLGAMLAQTPEFDAAVNVHTLLVGVPPWTPLTDESLSRRKQAQEAGPPDAAWFPNLVVSLPSGHCITVGPNAESKDAVDRLVDGIITWAQERAMATVSFLYVEPDEKVLMESLTERGLFHLPVTVNCDLSLTGDSFDDYLLTLPQNRRTSIRREIREVRGQGLSIERRGLEESLEDLVRLRLEQKRKYGRAPNEAKARQAFTGLIENFPPERLVLFTAQAGQDMVSFSLFIEGDNKWVALMTGTEYDDPRWKFVYFDLLFYSPIRHAYEAGYRQIDFGAASWEAKRNRGCDYVTAHGFVLPLRRELEETTAEASRATELLYSDT